MRDERDLTKLQSRATPAAQQGWLEPALTRLVHRRVRVAFDFFSAFEDAQQGHHGHAAPAETRPGAEAVDEVANDDTDDDSPTTQQEMGPQCTSDPVSSGCAVLSSLAAFGSRVRQSTWGLNLTLYHQGQRGVQEGTSISTP